MKSVRLDPELEQRLGQAAAAANVSESQLIREAIAERCRAILGDRLDHRLGDVIGSVRGRGPGVARDTGRRFTDLLTRRRRPR